MKTCFFCGDPIIMHDISVDGVDACLTCGRIFNRIKIKLMKEMIDGDSTKDGFNDCLEIPFA